MDTEFPLHNLIPEIISEQNLFESFDYVVGHLEIQRQRERFKPCREAFVNRLKQEISAGTFRITKFRQLHVKDGFKERDVQAPQVYDRVGCHAIMVIVELYTYPTLINNTAASIKGRGMHWLHHIIEEDLKNYGDSMRYYYQCDIEHYYDSILQDLMKAEIRKYISDPVLLPMLDDFITLLPNGLSKGLRSSQCFANLFLSPLDHSLCKIVPKYKLIQDDNEITRYLYYRYCDDFVVFAKTKKELWKIRNFIADELGKLSLNIKPNETVKPIECGLDFLGYVNFGTHSLIRKRTKQKFARRMVRVKSRKRRQELIGSFKGMAIHANCNHLFYKLTHHQMKKFSEMGVTYTPADGKKRFPGKVVRLATIVNKEIEVHDYEQDVTTAQGDGRYLVSFKEKKSGEWAKFFTASEEMKSILDQISNIEDGFPFETIIESDVFDGNKVKYKFT